jgi:hypothetical protein
MNKKSFKWVVIFGMVIVIAISVMAALAAMNTVPVTLTTDQIFTISPNDLKPPECAGITLTNKILCPSSGTCDGTKNNDLMIANSGNPSMNGNDGDDCVVCYSPGGRCNLHGNKGTDVCVCKSGSCSYSADCETQIR